MARLRAGGLAGPGPFLRRGSPADAAHSHRPRGIHLLTPRFASPEQLLDRPITPPSDLYQLGPLLYQLLCVERSDTVDGLADRLRGGLDHVVVRALAVEPGERFASVEALSAAVRSEIRADG